jgi:hypothetical protein
MMTILISWSWTTFLSLVWWNLWIASSILQYGKNFLRNIFIYPLPPNGWQPLGIWYILDGSFWTWLLNHDDDLHLTLSSHRIYELFSLMHSCGYVPNPTYKHHTHRSWWLVHKAHCYNNCSINQHLNKTKLNYNSKLTSSLVWRRSIKKLKIT